MSLSIWLLVLAAGLYSLTFLFYAISFSSVEGKGSKAAFVLMRAAFLVATFYLAAEALENGFFLPVANLSQALAFFAWSLAFVYLVLLVKAQNESFGLILTPILLLLIAAALVSRIFGESPLPPKPVLLNPYFILHIASAFFAYACFTISFAAALLYLMQNAELKARRAGKFYHKLASLEELERLIYQPILWGAPLLCAAAGIGFIWSKSAFGELWIFDPKTIATFVTAFLYLVILYLRYISALRGKQVALLSLIAFGLVVFSFVGTRFIEGSHNYLQ